jgi:hypothetical protein
MGMSGDALEASVGGDSISGLPCERLEGSTWICAGSAPNLLGIADYRVTVDSQGCWTAIRMNEGSLGKEGWLGPRPRLSGCVTIFDYLGR